ncbi:MAG: ParB/RepB/Spo0J family partition protein [Erysipelotrichaceae bacterium]|nr:ParB/RepB/Spo0J family partition protein [Erysipelotrichaceae bacterium]
MAKSKGLSKGLNNIFGGDIDRVISDIEKGVSQKGSDNILISEIRPNPYQPRKIFDETKLKELAISIKEHGIFQPVLLKEAVSGYEIVAGERRCRAAKMAGLEKIPAIIVEISDNDMMEIALLENIQRENLNAIEEARGYKVLMERLELTQQELSDKIGKSRSHIANSLRLLNLAPAVQSLVMDDKISMGHARALVTIDSDKAARIASRIVDEHLSVRDVENLVKQADKDAVETRNDPVEKDPEPKVEYKTQQLQYVESLIRKKFQTKVAVNNNAITIKYTDLDDLNRILELMEVIEES